MACCRYVFFPIDPIVVFADGVDPNSAVYTNGPCAICYRELASPEVLPCRHVFCLECLREWAEACRQTNHPAVCPLCREPFLQSQLRTCEAALCEGKLVVHSLTGLLHELSVCSCRVIKAAHIFRVWTDQHKKWFWDAFTKVVASRHRRSIYLHLTKATVAYILAATPTDVVHAMDNFGLAASKDSSHNTRYLLLFLMTKLGAHK
jgi:hypothetical protein